MKIEQDVPLQLRLAEVERQLAELREHVLGIKPRVKDWRKTVGTFPRDKMTLEAEKLGRKWRIQDVKG